LIPRLQRLKTTTIFYRWAAPIAAVLRPFRPLFVIGAFFHQNKNPQLSVALRNGFVRGWLRKYNDSLSPAGFYMPISKE